MHREPLVRIQHDDPDVDGAFAGVGEPSHDRIERIFALTVAKPFFRWYSIVLFLRLLELFGLHFIFSGYFLRAT